VSGERTIPWRAVFDNDRRVEVEIGPGNGDVLLAFARAAPAVNFFGIERTWGAADAIVRRATRRGLTNVRAVAGDARCILAELVPEASVAAYHLYFPDPWPKTRHRARRLTGNALALTLARTLVRGGVVHVATDLATLLASFEVAFERAGLVRGPADAAVERPRTIFERKYGRAGTHHAHFVRP
jgi:tRNA (guanine-N7-)-methyltransferase